MLNKKNKLEKRIQELESKLESVKTAVTELKVLNEIAIDAGKTENVEQTLELILNKTLSFINAENGVIFLVSEHNEILETYIKLAKNSRLNKKPRIGEHITGWVLSKKTPLIIKDLSKDERFKTTEEERKIIKSLICSPIWFEGKIIGILQMINKKIGTGRESSFTEDDLSLLSIISAHAGQLIENSKLQQLNFKRIKETERARLETIKLQELDRLKANFFTNLSHEFRTPLTLILGPAEKISSQTSSNVIKDSEVIKRNSQRLLQLVNQLLDLSRLEAGKMKLEVSEQNIIQLLKGSFLSFASLAERKKITFKFNTSVENLNIYIDEDKVEKVIDNLLSNAFKFTPAGGRVELKVSKNVEYVNISIEDTGIGIPKEKISKIFDRFYQVDGTHKREYEGTGIGLALSKELIELHKGKIVVGSVEGKGTTITISMPLGKKYYTAEEICKPVKNEKTNSDFISESILFEETWNEKFNVNAIIETEKPLLLLVEDNSDVRTYIRENLEKEYTILEAVNGEEGQKKSIEQIPDLIISDVMMPKMDGFELCEKLKTDERTSHIPVILLTAKATSKDKITGYETGADDYIMKPFDVKELRVRVKNLIDQRKKLREHFLQEGIFSLDSKDITSIDRKFFERAIKIINEHLSDLSFGVESFASELSIGRTTLYKKLIAIVGEPPGDFIKRIRLSKANELIKIKSGNISEIALEVGFNNPAYFSECFKKQFGVTPSKYQSTFTNH
jgi:signal transduction histidine kinase/CheY-like chemotaxis protein/AraC-like DNA-binding protein